MTATIVGADLGTCHTAAMNFFAKRIIHHRWLKWCPEYAFAVSNEKITTENEQTAYFLVGYILSNPWKTWFYVILNDKSRFKWVLKNPLNLPDTVLDKSLD